MRYRPRMAARTPRRSFATPFVVTLAAAPACYVQSAPQQPEPAPQQNAPGTVVANPPRPQEQPVAQTPPPDTRPNPVVMNPPRPADPQPTPVVMNPPRPSPPVGQSPPGSISGGPAAGTTWHVFKTKDGCEAAIDVSCPKGATCNPPPPQKYDCPDGIVTGKPMTIVSEGENICHVAVDPPSCPKGAMCNPPRPRRVTCPQ
jgi:hypothetical protein